MKIGDEIRVRREALEGEMVTTHVVFSNGKVKHYKLGKAIIINELAKHPTLGRCFIVRQDTGKLKKIYVKD
jgi:hypothetical protein